MTQKNKALWPWTLASEHWKWLRACVWVCSGLYYIPKPIHFSHPNKPRNVTTVWGYYVENMTIYFQNYTVSIRSKLCLVFLISRKRGYVGKPLWWAHTDAACRPVVENRCLIAPAPVPGSFRESTMFSRPWCLMCRMLNWSVLLSSWVYHHLLLFVFVWFRICSRHLYLK